MPQMAPISWLILFIMFSAIFMMFNMMNYFSFLPECKKTSQSNLYSTNSPNWKW